MTEIKIKKETKYALDSLLKIYTDDNYDSLIKYLIKFWEEEEQ